jgi:hypothetical protein
MDSLTKYRDIIQKILTDYAAIPFPHGGLRDELVFDREQDRYMLITTGWNGPRRVHNIVIHLDIIAGKIWIQADNTDAVIARDLEKAGVPKSDIVLGFRHPNVRPLTEYAVA